MKLNKSAFDGKWVKVKNKAGEEKEVHIIPVMMTRLNIPEGIKTNNTLLNWAIFNAGVDEWKLEDECNEDNKEKYFNFDITFAIDVVNAIYGLNEEVLKLEKN